MIFRKKKNNIKLIFFNQITFFVIGFILLAVIAYPLSKKLFKKYQLNKEVAELNEEIKKMESHNQDLKNLITYLDSKSFAEEEARLSLNLKKNGEEVVVIKKGNENNAIKTEEIGLGGNKEESEKKETNPVRWWKYFFMK